MHFGLVGGAATLVHFVVALSLIAFGIHPLWSNALGFVVAFQVSYFGHRSFTFKHPELPIAQSMRRFAVVATGGFLLDEGLLAVLLVWTALPAPVALAAALLVVAGVTFVAVRLWVFVGQGVSEQSDHNCSKEHYRSV